MIIFLGALATLETTLKIKNVIHSCFQNFVTNCQILLQIRAGNLCTRDLPFLRFFGFDAGFTSDHPCIVGIQFVGGLK